MLRTFCEKHSLVELIVLLELSAYSGEKLRDVILRNEVSYPDT